MKKQYWFGLLLAIALGLAATAAPPAAPEPSAETPTSTSGSSLIDEVLAQDKAEGRGILDETEGDRRVQEGLIKARVEKELSDARNQMGTDPDGVEQAVKSLSEMIRLAGPWSTETRAQRLTQVHSAVRAARQESGLGKAT